MNQPKSRKLSASTHATRAFVVMVFILLSLIPRVTRAGPLTPLDYFPVAVGWWAEYTGTGYRSSSVPHWFQERTRDLILAASATSHCGERMRVTVQSDEWDPDLGSSVYTGDVGTDAVTFSGKVLLKAPIVLGATWSYQTTGYHWAGPETGVGSIAAVGETVATPAGTFPDCIRVDYQEVADQGGRHFRATESYWYAPGVGIVRWMFEHVMWDDAQPGAWTHSADLLLTGCGPPRPVVVLVRGLQFAGSTDADAYWAAAKCYLEEAGFEVWVCDLITGMEEVGDAAGRLHTFVQGKISERRQRELPAPESISIVAHCYGGLITRKFVHQYCKQPGHLPGELLLPGGDKTRIDKVVMLSGVNCGSRLADSDVAKGLSWFFGSDEARSCTEPDFVQNNFNHACPDAVPLVPYHLVGATGWSRNPLLWIPSRYLVGYPPGTSNDNDGVVTTCSAHGYRWLCPCDPEELDNCSYCDWVSDREVGGEMYTTADDHFSICSNRDTLELVRTILRGEAVTPVSEPGCALSPEHPSTGVVVNAADGTIFQGQTTQVTAIVDDCPYVSFSLDYEAGGLSYTLTSPTGTVIDPTSADPSVHYSEVSDEAGAHASYVIDDPSLGTWSATIGGVSVDPAGAGWSLAVSEESSLRLVPGTEYFQSAGDVVVSAAVVDGSQRITGATVAADVRRPDQTVDHLALYDDGAHSDGVAGDGLYANTYHACSSPGIYEAQYTATGVNLQGHNFSRIAGDTFQIAPQTVTLSGVYNDHGEDIGPPPGIESIVVDVGINVLSGGDYAVSAELADSNGNVLAEASASAASLPTGPASISLRFSADTLRRSGVDGPYRLMNVALWDDSGGMSLRADYAESPYTTGAYQFSEFSDRTPPEAVRDLSISDVDLASGGVTLRWTAPSSEGAPAASYDIRATFGGLNSENWDTAYVLPNPPTPASPGTVQTLTVTVADPMGSYFFGIKSLDQDGNESPLSNVASLFLGSGMDVRNAPDGSYGGFVGIVTAGGVEDGISYVESPDRAWGIRVEADDLPESHRVYVTGFMRRTGAEPRVADAVIRDLGPDTPIRPLGMSGSILRPGTGLESTGLLVRAWGSVTAIAQDYVYLDDGSHLRDGTVTGTQENVGVRVVCDPSGLWPGDCVAITGISSCFLTDSEQIARRILVREPGDIAVYRRAQGEFTSIGPLKQFLLGRSVTLQGAMSPLRPTR